MDAPVRTDTELPRQTISGKPYVLGPVIGKLGPYAIVDWIDWNGRRYAFGGLLAHAVERVYVLEDALIVPPRLHYVLPPAR